MPTILIGLLVIITVASFVFLILISRLSVDEADLWLRPITGILLLFTFVVGGAMLFTGYVVVNKLSIRVADAQTEASNAQERAANAERELLKLKLPRWARLAPLDEYVKGKSVGSVEVIFVPENDEAQKTAFGLEAILSTDGKWKVLRNAHPYSDADILPRFLTPAFKENPFHQSLFERVGGLSDITVLASPADFKTGPPLILKEGTAAEALWRGLHNCGFEAIAAVEPRLHAGTARIVVGPKQ